MRDLEHLRSLLQVGIRSGLLCFEGSTAAAPPPPWLDGGVEYVRFVRFPAAAAAGVGAALRRGARYICGDLAPELGLNGHRAYPSCYLYDEVGGRERVLEAVREYGASAVLLRSWFLPWARELKRRGQLVIVDAHDSLTLSAAEIFRTMPHRRRWFSLPMVIATRRMERRYLRYCDEVWAPSAVDAKAIRAVEPRVRCLVYPNLVSIPGIEAPGDASVDAADILFVGNMAYPPNAEGVEWLVRRVLPLVWHSRPDASVTIVGHGAPESVAAVARSESRIAVTGRVSDLTGYYARAKVVVVPVLRGAGTKVKLLEGMAFGKALVSTSKGAEGVALINRRHLLCADTPEEFAGAIIELLGLPPLRRELAAHARELARASYADVLGPSILMEQSVLCR